MLARYSAEQQSWASVTEGGWSRFGASGLATRMPAPYLQGRRRLPEVMQQHEAKTWYLKAEGLPASGSKDQHHS